ncbi:MAG TPA: glycosyltransferase, partial [Ferruginibacter sp.]|nr:glycosyltransferase [Ferruginibacter sp.]
AGKLSHTNQLPIIPVKYIGVLSRFKKEQCSVTNKLLIVLSGPEPQRSIFESMILLQIKDYGEQVILVRGLPAQTATLSLGENIQVFNHLPSNELNKKIQESAMVLARAGYSTIMDLATLQQKAILVPTPGQAEQEYLATYLKQQQLFYTCFQDKFDLKIALKESELFYKTGKTVPCSLNENLINDWLTEIKKIKASL